jgi:hypothetical protein
MADLPGTDLSTLAQERDAEQLDPRQVEGADPPGWPSPAWPTFWRPVPRWLIEEPGKGHLFG